MINICYFGPLADALGRSKESLAWNDGGDTEDLLDWLRRRGDFWEEALAEDKIYKVVVNRQICHVPTPIPDGAEIGLLPPVTGG